MLRVCEIFKSIQGESTFTGRVCSFVRLSGCNLSCSYCDTRYAETEGSDYAVDRILDEVQTHATSLVEITGGEPLVQKETAILCRRLLDKHYTVLIETNGSQDISVLPDECIRIVDIKCPSSGHGDSFLEKNYAHLTVSDECKFVIGDRADYDWASAIVRSSCLDRCGTVIFSPNTALLSASTLAGWIIGEPTATKVRMGLQMHKVIWGDTRGV